ncbi:MULTISPECIES: helix-turn-helix domain-containing protein [Actibacterium]|uniref:Transcriptional regulator with XRE-family HTH domain n=1 Tax=Actibacterium naphthalenivorans TaxID=1614693 RepID=A0A840CEJ8_9RHOB|nr:MULTISPECIES: helix-turn-helix transcriptional regulator [Actibacterium]MBB4022522.1 transcriptional regulator with XRE-family HTH domain [Actibacterium naphthalenivorans]
MTETPPAGGEAPVFGQYLKKRLAEENLNPSRLANLSQVSRTSIGRYISGKIATPNPFQENKILKALDGPEAYLEHYRQFRETGLTHKEALRAQSSEGSETSEVAEASEVLPDASEDSGQSEISRLDGSSRKDRHFRASWAILGLAAIILAPAIPWFLDLAHWRLIESELLADKADEPTKEQQAYETAKESILNSGIHPQFDVVWNKEGATVWLNKIDELPSEAQIEVSRDGITYARASNVANLLPNDQFIVRLNHYAWERPIGPFDFTDEVQALATAAIANSSSEQGGPITCAAGSCEISRYSFCNGNWSKLTLGRSPDTPEVDLDLEACDNVGLLNDCLSTPATLFPTGPLQTIYAELHANQGGTYRFSFKTLPLSFDIKNNGEEAVELTPLPPNVENAPYATAWFSKYTSNSDIRFRMYIGAGSCRVGDLALEDQFSAIYYDADGNGNLRGDLRYFSIPEPSRDFVEITLVGKDSTIFGPYRYRFPSDEIIARAVAATEKPDTFECDRKLVDPFDTKSWYYSCSAPSEYQNIYDWAKVSEIHFGSSPDNLSKIIKIDMSPRQMAVAQADSLSGDQPPVFEYSPPKDSRDLYFKIYYVDGSQGLLQRMTLPEPM